MIGRRNNRFWAPLTMCAMQAEVPEGHQLRLTALQAIEDSEEKNILQA